MKKICGTIIKLNMIANPLLTILFSTGIIFLIMGFIMYKFPPRKINGLYGYRTAKSMGSQERWDFAQTYSAKEMMKSGLIFSIVGLFGIIFQPDETIATIVGLGIIIVCVIILIARVERALNRNFKDK